MADWDVVIDACAQEPGKGWLLRRLGRPDVFIGTPTLPWEHVIDAAMAFMDAERLGSFPSYLECTEARMGWCTQMSLRGWRRSPDRNPDA